MSNRVMSPPEPKAPIISRPRGFLIVILLVVVRSLAPLIWSDVYFDADQAVMGLMAKHIAEGRAFPVFQYGAPYVLVIEAYLAAPLIALAGPSPLALRLVPFAFNVGTAVLLFGLLTSRSTAMRPSLALLATVPVAMPGLNAVNTLMTAIGMNVEPLFFSLVIWALRTRPVPLGVVSAIALKNREFVIYALAAMLFLDLLRDRSAALWRPRLVGLMALTLTWAAVDVLYQRSSVMGPGTTVAMLGENRDNLAVAASAMCIAPEQMPGDVWMVASELLPLQWGVRSARWRTATHPGHQPPDATLLWVPLVAVLVFGIGRGLWRAYREGPSPATWLGLFLVMVGTQAVLVYALTRCGNASFFTMRYMVLSVFIPSGALVLALERERGRLARAAVISICAVWFGVVAAGHVTVLRGFMSERPMGSYRQLADYLVAHDISYIEADYWIGYHVAFLTGERVRALTNFDRILDHQRAVSANRDQAWSVWRRDGQCANSTRVGALYVCAPGTARSAEQRTR